MIRPSPSIAYHRAQRVRIPSAAQTREGASPSPRLNRYRIPSPGDITGDCDTIAKVSGTYSDGPPYPSADYGNSDALRAAFSHRRNSPIIAAGVASGAIAVGVGAVEGMDTFLASAGAVFYDMGHTAWGHPVSSAAAAALLVASVVFGEPLLDRLFGKIPHAGMRRSCARWFPGPGSALMGIAFVEGLGKVVAHHLSDTASALDVSYVQGLGAMWFVTFFGMHTFLHHLRDEPDAKDAKIKAKLLCLADDIPALALVLAS